MEATTTAVGRNFLGDAVAEIIAEVWEEGTVRKIAIIGGTSFFLAFYLWIS